MRNLSFNHLFQNHFRHQTITLLFIIVGFLPFNASAAAPDFPILTAKAYLLKDVNSQTVIAEKNSDVKIEPASLTKLMTAYLTFKALHAGVLTLDKQLPISAFAFKAEGSRMFIDPLIPVTVNELLFGLIVQSGNDAAITLAEGVEQTEANFAEKMNKEATRLGMKHTHFMNATGLPDPEHYTTALDLLLLAEAIIRDYPEEYKRYYSTKSYTYNKIKQNNRNRLLWIDPFVDGMKTGHTQSAGYCLIATSKRDEVRRISVLLGAPNEEARMTESQKLLNYGFMNFDTTLLYPKGQKVNVIKVWKGANDTVEAVVNNDVYVTMLKGEVKKLKAVVNSVQPLLAPIKAQQKIGTLQLMQEEKLMKAVPLVAKEAVPSAGIIGQVIDSIQLLLH